LPFKKNKNAISLQMGVSFVTTSVQKHLGSSSPYMVFFQSIKVALVV